MVLLPGAVPSPVTSPLFSCSATFSLSSACQLRQAVMTHLSVTFKLRDKQDSQGVRLLVSVNHSFELDALPKPGNLCCLHLSFL